VKEFGGSSEDLKYAKQQLKKRKKKSTNSSSRSSNGSSIAQKETASSKASVSELAAEVNEEPEAEVAPVTENKRKRRRQSTSEQDLQVLEEQKKEKVDEPITPTPSRRRSSSATLAKITVPAAAAAAATVEEETVEKKQKKKRKQETTEAEEVEVEAEAEAEEGRPAKKKGRGRSKTEPIHKDDLVLTLAPLEPLKSVPKTPTEEIESRFIDLLLRKKLKRRRMKFDEFAEKFFPLCSEAILGQGQEHGEEGEEEEEEEKESPQNWSDYFIPSVDKEDMATSRAKAASTSIIESELGASEELKQQFIEIECKIFHLLELLGDCVVPKTGELVDLVSPKESAKACLSLMETALAEGKSLSLSGWWLSSDKTTAEGGEAEEGRKLLTEYDELFPGDTSPADGDATTAPSSSLSLQSLKDRLQSHGYSSFSDFAKDFYEFLNQGRQITEPHSQVTSLSPPLYSCGLVCSLTSALVFRSGGIPLCWLSSLLSLEEFSVSPLRHIALPLSFLL
jgi:hypothetical protein